MEEPTCTENKHRCEFMAKFTEQWEGCLVFSESKMSCEATIKQCGSDIKQEFKAGRGGTCL